MKAKGKVGENGSGMKALLGSIGVLAAGLAVIFAATMLIPQGLLAQYEVRLAIDFLSLVDIALVLFLLYTYIKSYIEVKSKFTFGLLLFVTAIMLFVMTTSRIVLGLLDPAQFGFGMTVCTDAGTPPVAGVQALDIVPLLFSAIALSILAYLSNE